MVLNLQNAINWGFQHLTINKLVGVINPNNEHSRRVLEKVNMNYVGRAHYWDNEVALYDIQKPQVNYNRPLRKLAFI